MFKVTQNLSGKCVIALSDIPENTLLMEDNIDFYINKNKDLWYEEIIYYELKNNRWKFEDLVPNCFDNNIFTDPIFTKNYKSIDESINHKDLILYYNKIIRNAFKIDDKNNAAILYNGRLFNHSCVPNVKFSLEKSKNKYVMKFYTSRKVKKGEELCDNYFNTELSFKKRQEISKRFYGFVCKCKKCIHKK